MGRLVPLLDRALGDLTTWFPRADRRFRYREGVLEEGEVVSVLGHAVREVRPDGERATSRSPPQRLVLRGNGPEPLRISDETRSRGQRCGRR